MVNVLIVASAVPPRQAILVEALEQFRSRGSRVHLACFFDLDQLPIDPGLAHLHALPKPTPGGPRPRRALRGAAPSRRIWLNVRRDRWLRQHSHEADVLVALDVRAVYTVWQLAQRNRRADAVYGLTPALKAIEARIENPVRRQLSDVMRTGPSPLLLVSGARRSTRDVAKTVVQGATSSTVMRSSAGRRIWSAALGAPGIPDGPRTSLTRRVQASMTRAGHPSSAAGLGAVATRHLRDPRMKAELLGPLTEAELTEGRVPHHLGAVATGELATADAFLRRRNVTEAIASTARAMDLLFHRVLHFDGLSSPIAEDPEAFLAPFHKSAVGRALATPRGRAESAAAPPSGRPLRLLFFTGINDTFLTPIRERYESLPGVEVRCLDLSTGPVRTLLGSGRAKLIAHGLTGRSKDADQAADLLGPALTWADTVFVDWCAASAALLTLFDPGKTRVVIRVHSFETFSWWPHLVDFSRVDDVVFVSEHLRDLTTAVVPRLGATGAPRTHVISNAMDLHRYPADKPAEARFNLGLVGISAVAKDPRWAIEVLRVLREQDPRYRLLLVGSDLNAEASAAAKRYREAYENDLADLEPAGIVRRLGQLQDVPAALTDVGVILSTSVRESFHCALVEGTASGALPVVRNWPFFAGRPHDARTLFPTDWVVDTPEEAARRILALTRDEEVWREAGRAASAHVLATWDWRVTRQDFDRLLLGGPATDQAAPDGAPCHT